MVSDQLSAPNNVIWVIMNNHAAILVLNLASLSTPNAYLKSGVVLLIYTLFKTMYMACLGILIGSFARSFTQKCSAAARLANGQVLRETAQLFEQFVDLKTSCQLGLFISFTFGTMLATIHTYSAITVTFQPCFEAYNTPTFMILFGLNVAVNCLYMYFYALSMDECYQSFRGILALLR